jgi:hypothetical protein
LAKGVRHPGPAGDHDPGCGECEQGHGGGAGPVDTEIGDDADRFFVVHHFDHILSKNEK